MWLANCADWEYSGTLMAPYKHIPMKYALLIFFLTIAFCADAQQVPLTELPQGTYEARIKSTQQKWSVGDISIVNSGRYEVSNGEAGEYRFSVAAQRVFFTSGTLRGMHANTASVNNVAVIIFPAAGHQPIPLSGDVWATYKR